VMGDIDDDTMRGTRGSRAMRVEVMPCGPERKHRKCNNLHPITC
jgi:hypothetical protein